MTVALKTDHEIDLMRHAGKLLGQTLQQLTAAVRPGMTTWELNKLGEDIIRGYGCIPSFLDYNGFPAAICISVNDEVVHGIPRGDITIEEGDIVSLDAGLIYKGYHADAARTVPVGNVSRQAERLIKVTEECFFEGMKYAVDGAHLYDISAAIAAHAKKNHYGVVRELTGHGIGKNLHEEPFIPNYRPFLRKGPKLEAGMTLAVEPMINEGSRHIYWKEDNWTVCTDDGSLSAHYENTILITDGEPEILTLI